MRREHRFKLLHVYGHILIFFKLLHVYVHILIFNIKTTNDFFPEMVIAFAASV